MDLTPRDIQDKQFHDAFRGYSHEEVDMFLDEVALSFEKIFKENQSLHHRLRETEQQLIAARGTEDMLKRTLLTAQKTAEEAIEEARQKAQAMIVASERKAQEIVATAERRSQEILAQAVTKEREIQFALEGLKRFESEYKARLRAFIESQLQVLAEGPSMPAELEVMKRSVATEVARVEPSQTRAEPEVEPSAVVRTEPHVEPSAVVRAEPEVATNIEQPSPNLETEFAPSDVQYLPAELETTMSIPEPETAAAPRSVDVRSTSGPGGRTDDSSPPSRPLEDDDEERSIKELFWGEE